MAVAGLAVEQTSVPEIENELAAIRKSNYATGEIGWSNNSVYRSL